MYTLEILEFPSPENKTKHYRYIQGHAFHSEKLNLSVRVFHLWGDIALIRY